MALYAVNIKKSAIKELQKLPETVFTAVDAKILSLENNPFPQYSKKLIGESNLYRLRQGNYRIIYSVEEESKTIEILKIKHRKDVYK